MKKLELNINLINYLTLTMIFLIIFFNLLLFNFDLALAFGSQRHNIDLTLNFAQLCGECIWDIKDMGTDHGGNFVNITLADSYVSSMHLNYVQYRYSFIFSFLMGVSFVLALVYFSGSIIIINKLNNGKLQA